MNILLWILQILVAAHTAIGAIWKFSNSEQNVGALKVIPHFVWVSMGIVEILCAIGLVLPLLNKNLGKTIPIAALLIALEMVVFSIIQGTSPESNPGHIIYWLIVAAICSFIAYGRFIGKPL